MKITKCEVASFMCNYRNGRKKEIRKIRGQDSQEGSEEATSNHQERDGEGAKDPASADIESVGEECACLS